MTTYVDEDFVGVRKSKVQKKPTMTLSFGDPVEVLGIEDGFTRVRVPNQEDGTFEGFIKGVNLPLRDEGVLSLSAVDVQQGDGLILETPEGKIVFIDGGDNKLFARHAAKRYQHKDTSVTNRLNIDAIVVTHGDADHFDGLNELKRSESLTGQKAHKRIFIHPERVFHNGLVKSPAKRNNQSVPDLERFGHTIENNGVHYIVDLYDDPRHASFEAQGGAFRHWSRTLDHWESHSEIDVRRVDFDMEAAELFDFLHEEGITVEIQGPFTEMVTDPATGAERISLPFLSRPKKTPELHLESGGEDDISPSASHTINGHSITLRLTFRNVRFQLTGDLNRDAMQRIRNHIPDEQLEAEIVKAPHHGSHDFDFQSLELMRPVVAFVSSGDEDTFHEHIHPRATLLAALGKVMRNDSGVIFVTELAAFFHKRDYCYKRSDLARYFKDHADQSFTGDELRKLFTGVKREGDPPNLFYGFERTNFGIVHIRTDGERVLAFTHSGKKGLNEAYRFRVDDDHEVTFEAVTTR